MGPAAVAAAPAGPAGPAVDRLQVIQFDRDGLLAGPAVELAPLSPIDSSVSRGDIPALGDGAAVSAWREPRPHDGSCYRTRGAVVRPADGIVTSDTVLHQTEASTAVDFDATAVVAAGRVWIVSSGPDGMLLSPQDEPTRVVRLSSHEAPPIGELRAASFADDRTVVAWSERISPDGTGNAGLAAVVTPDTVLVPATTIFPPTADRYADVYLAVNDGSIYLARYDRDDRALRDSRIRVARLDSALQRVEPDRWINGWGGVTPGGLALLAWQGDVWVVFQTLDARYGTNPVLFAQPLARPTCGYAVDVPVAVFPPHWLSVNSLLAAPGDDEIWAVVEFVRDNATAELYRLVHCD